MSLCEVTEGWLHSFDLWLERNKNKGGALSPNAQHTHSWMVVLLPHTQEGGTVL